MEPRESKPIDNRQPVDPKWQKSAWDTVKSWASTSIRNCSEFFQTNVRHLSIRQKIRYGYALTLSIAVIGTTVGLVLGNRYQAQALQKLSKSRIEQALLKELQISMLEMRSQQKGLAYLLVSPNLTLIESKSASFVQQAEKVKGLLDRVNSAPSDSNLSELKSGLQEYARAVEVFMNQVKILLDRASTEPFKVNADETQVLRRRLLDFTDNAVFSQFDLLTANLTKLLEILAQEVDRANSHVEEAKLLRDSTISVSILLSIAIAAMLAIYTSREIAIPIEQLTQLAKRVLKEDNFALQAEVTTRDEVGSLAVSLNQLIRYVADYTNALENSHQTLERRVQIRIKELSRENQQLQEVHDRHQLLYSETQARTNELEQSLQKLQGDRVQLIQSEKMSSLERLVTGIAEEIQHPVNTIDRHIGIVEHHIQKLLELVRLSEQENPRSGVDIQNDRDTLNFEAIEREAIEVLSVIKAGAAHICEIVRGLQSFSRCGETQRQPVDIHEGIDSTLSILKPRLAKNIAVVKQYGNLPPVECYPAQINQVLMNILSNAIDALEESSQDPLLTESYFIPTITIATELMGQGADSEAQAPPVILPRGDRSDLPEIAQPSAYAVIRIKDNGSGIPYNIQDKLFDPFFTTRPAGQGTGLGLSISYQIVQRHEGQIEVISMPGKGAEFAIALPVSLSNSSTTASEG